MSNSTQSSIGTIARFEAKTLVRGWLFKIFAILAVLFLLFFNFVNLVDKSASIIAGSAPYVNLKLLNFIQAVIAIFLSSDFIGRDKKLDTTESFYVRSISNSSYVIGKTLGIGLVFMCLNLFVLLISFVYNVLSTTDIIVPIAYLIYPLLISLPTVILVVGLSFFLMTIVKNQAVTFIIMLGILGVGLFYLSNKWYNVLDFIGLYTPMAYSVFTGLPEITNLLLVRGAYMLLGIGFIFFTILMLPRLPQEKFFKTRAVAGMFLTFIPAIIMISTYLIRNNNDEKLRAEILKLEETLPSIPSLKITDNFISLIHNGKTVTITSKITAIIESNNDLYLILNSGFDVKSVKIEGKETDFERNLHTILLKNDNIRINEPVEIEIVYSGAPNDKATYPETPEDIRNGQNRAAVFDGKSLKQISFITNKYILLTTEADWYPVAASRNYRSYRQFTNFSLETEISTKLTVFSQGKKESDSNGKIKFVNEKPLNALSITAGEYATHTLIIDSVEITLAMNPKHIKIYEKYFNEISDTIPILISDMKNDFERKLNLSYPFKRFSMIEVPIHFFTYPRNWTLTTEDNMPEQLLIAERGGQNYSYYPQLQEKMINWGNWQNEDAEKILSREMQARVFKNIIGNNLFSTNQAYSSTFYGSENVRSLNSWNYNVIFPQYTTNAFGIKQENFPAIQFIIENYLFSRLQTMTGGGRQNLMSFEGVNAQIILKLQEKNLLSLLDSLKYDPRLADLVSRKGKELFEIIKLNIENQDIDDILNSIIIENRFEPMSVYDFTHTFDSITNIKISSLIDNCLNNNLFPAYLFGETRVSKIMDKNRERFFVRMQVVNNGTGEGIITVGIREGEQQRVMMRGRGMGGGGAVRIDSDRMPAPVTFEKTYNIPVGAPMEIGIMLDSEPRVIMLNTYTAQNLPTTRMIQINDVIEENVTGFEGIRPYNGTISISQPNEYIVDNEDEGFSVSYQKEAKTLKDWWMARNMAEVGDKYHSIEGWNPSYKWQFVFDGMGMYYGTYIKSAVYIRKGTGINSVHWETELAESGNYSVYVFLPQNPNMRTWRRGREQTESGTYVYTVSHDDGEDVVNVDIEKHTGWYLLGDFYISKGKTSISLSDKTERRIVVGDAVKWTKR